MSVKLTAEVLNGSIKRPGCLVAGLLSYPPGKDPHSVEYKIESDNPFEMRPCDGFMDEESHEYNVGIDMNTDRLIPMGVGDHVASPVEDVSIHVQIGNLLPLMRLTTSVSKDRGVQLKFPTQGFVWAVGVRGDRPLSDYVDVEFGHDCLDEYHTLVEALCTTPAFGIGPETYQKDIPNCGKCASCASGDKGTACHERRPRRSCDCNYCINGKRALDDMMRKKRSKKESSETLPNERNSRVTKRKAPTDNRPEGLRKLILKRGRTKSHKGNRLSAILNPSAHTKVVE